MKTILITGSTDGIGKLTAIQLAKEGHRVLVHGRNPEKLKTTTQEIIKHSGNDNISGFLSDLSDFGSIQKFIDEVMEQLVTLDVLINNAGVFKSTISTNGNGLDIRFAVNYFAPYLLTNGLIPLFQKSAAPRLINLSSAAQAPISLEALKGNAVLSEQDSYAQSKLALTMWSFYLSQKIDFLNVIAVNPGSLLNTRMVQEAYGQFWSSADKGASILSELATLEKYENRSGTYFDNDKGTFVKAHSDAYRPEKITQLISETEKILETI